MTGRPCPRCHLTGSRLERGYRVICPRCDGTGMVPEDPETTRVRDEIRKAA